MDEYELTPVSNVAFNGVVAEEINRLNKELKKAHAEIERLQAKVDYLTNERDYWQYKFGNGSA